MKNEVIIRNWLMGWLRPEVETELGEAKRQPITDINYREFIEQFRDEKKDLIFSEDEIAILKPVLTKPVKFSTGYPLNDKEAIQPYTIYLIEGGWQQASSYLGANYWDGKASTYITVTGKSAGETLNMAEPSLLLNVITSLLIAGRGYFYANHMTEPAINETLYASDEDKSMKYGFAMRSLTISYSAHRHGVLTSFGVIPNGK
jgi:hypothetical protein